MNIESIESEERTSEIHAWSRHYDTLVWTVTAILASANGALMVYSLKKENFHWLAYALGLALTFATVYFAASFRSNRRRLHDMLSKDEQALVHGSRVLPQWWLYIAIFLGILVAWMVVFDQHKPDSWWGWCTGITVAILCIVIAVRADRLQVPKKRN